MLFNGFLAWLGLACNVRSSVREAPSCMHQAGKRGIADWPAIISCCRGVHRCLSSFRRLFAAHVHALRFR